VSDPSQIGEAFVRIRPRANPGEFQRETEQSLAPATKAAGDTLSRSLGDALSVGAFAVFSTAVVRSAAEAEQAVGGTAAVFKDARGEIDEFAKGSAESLGLTEQATRQFSSQIGSALKGYGFSIEDAADTSQKLITKGADLTALFGGTVPEAVTAMSAALRGEFDPLERYGVSLTAAAVAAKAVELGLAQSTSAVDGHAKAVATLAIIEEQTADATGQFNRELGTAAGQMSVATAKLGNARDELGSRFLPLVSKGAGLVSTLADAFGSLPGPIQASVAAIVALVALQGPLGRIGEKVKDVATEMREGGEAATGFKNKLDAIAKTGVIVAGIAAITGGIEAFKQAQTGEVSDFFASLPDPSDIQGYSDAVNKAVERQAFLGDELNKFNNADLSKIPEGLGAAWNFFTSSVTGSVSEVGKLKAEYDALTSNLPAATQKAEELVVKVNDLGKGLGITGAEAADLVDDFKGLDLTQVPMNRLIDVLGALRREEISVEEAAERLGVGVSTAGDKALEAAADYEKLRAGLFGLVDAARAAEDAEQGVADAERNVQRAALASSDARRAQQQAILAVGDAMDAERDAQQNVIDTEQRRLDSLAEIEDAVRAVENAERRLQEARQGPTESDDLDVESAELRLKQMRDRLAEDTDATPTERRLQEIAIREAEIALAEKRAEIDGRAALAQDDLTEAQDRLAESERSADAAARAVTDAREAQADAARGIEAANYNAERAQRAVEDADLAGVKASRDVEQAKYDQLKASEELTQKMLEEQAAFSGANAEAGKLADYYRDLIALRPELAAAAAPLLFLLQSLKTAPGAGGQTAPGGVGAPFSTPFSNQPAPAPGGGGGGGGYYQPPGVDEFGRYDPGGIVYPGMPNQVVVEINANGIGTDEAAREIQRRVSDELAQAVGW
jgi:hypothetical protein